MTTLQTLLTSGGLVALGAVLGAVLGGVITNWLGDKRDRRRYEHEQAMAEQAQQHERTMARDARRQERLEQAYIALLGLLSYRDRWALSVRPFWGSVAKPDPLPIEEVKRIAAVLEAHGSPEVRGLFREWGARAGKLANADQTIELEEKATRPSDELTDQAMRELKAIPGYRDAMFEAAEAIRERVRQELADEA